MPQERKAPRILVVDDDEGMHRVLERAATSVGYDVAHAFDGESGLEQARSGAFDLVLLDVHMPHMDGRDVLSKLRGDPKTARVPVIILSARGAQLDRIQGLELGADDYIEKPFDAVLLMRKIARLIEKAHAAGGGTEPPVVPG